jgi:aminoglycoside phosphotransferase (APT) family kinase protein
MTSQMMSLLHADPLFPQRDLLLDPAFIAQRLALRLGVNARVQVEDCERVRATYRAGQSLRVIYKFRADGQPCMIAARAFPPGTKKESFQREFPAPSGDGTLHPMFWDDETDTAFWTFPHDRKIANLPALMNVPPTLSELLDSRWVESRLVAYASEKCATVRCLDRDQNVLAYAKVYAGDDGLACYNVYRALSRMQSAGSAGFTVPRAIFYSSSHRVLLLEAIEGRRIADLEGQELEHGLHSLGKTLAAFHGAPIPEGVPSFTRFHPERMQEGAAVIGLVRPDAAALAQQVSNALCSRAEALSGPAVCLHGDLHPKNGILRDGRIVLIDLDQAASGPAAADLGSFLAALRYEVVVGILSETAERRLADAFLSGYAAVSELPATPTLRWYAAAALFAERVQRSVSRVRPQGLERLSELLVATQQLLEGNND